MPTNRRFLFALISSSFGFGLSGLGLSGFGLLNVPAIAADIPARNQPAQTQLSQNQPSSPSNAVQRLGQMFSPDIQRIVNACWERGRITLTNGTQPNAPLLCGNGSPEPGVSQQVYIETISDILAASSLVGFRAVVESDPRLTPEMLRTFVGTSEGMQVLRNTIQTAITQSQLVATSANAAVPLLTDSIIARMLPVLQNPSGLTTLVGNEQQYQQVVRSFCTAPGMTIEQAKAQVPGLSPLQFYAICIQESGVTREVLPQGQQQPNNGAGGAAQ